MRISGRRHTGAAWLCLALMLAAASLACGTDRQADIAVDVGGPPTVATSTTALVVHADACQDLTSAAGTSVSPGFPQVFVDLAEALSPVTVYGWIELPEGTLVSKEWWPVVDRLEPELDEGTSSANPLVSHDQSEAQLVLQSGTGWLVVLENFRGDLGDVSGRSVGSIWGHLATLYEVNEGTLVQWSHEGLWYGLFGRKVTPDFVVDAALTMRPVVP